MDFDVEEELLKSNDDCEARRSSCVVANQTLFRRMQYLRVIYAVLCLQFFLFSSVSLILFITPNVRAFVQQNPWILTITTLSPLLTTFFLRKYRHEQLASTFLFFLHTNAVLFFIVGLTMYLDSEVVYLATIIVTGQFFLYFLFTFQYMKGLTLYHTALFALASSVFGSFFLQLLLSVFMFPFLHVIVISFCIFLALNYNIFFFMTKYLPRERFSALKSVFIDLPLSY